MLLSPRFYNDFVKRTPGISLSKNRRASMTASRSMKWNEIFQETSASKMSLWPLMGSGASSNQRLCSVRFSL